MIGSYITIDIKMLLIALFCLLGSVQAILTNLRTGSSLFFSRLIPVIRLLVDEQLLVNVELLLSSFLAEKNSGKLSSTSIRQPIDYSIHHLLRVQSSYMKKGKPLSAHLIQHQVLKVLEHVCYVSSSQGEPSPGFLPLNNFPKRFANLGITALTSMSDLVISQLQSAEVSADFIKFKNLPLQDITLELKATCLRLICVSLITTHGTDARFLSFLNVIRSVMVDPVQMSHRELSDACLNVVAAISINCQDYATELNRLLRNFIVSISNPSPYTVCVAAQRLAWCLDAVSKDKIVSTLYSLVNVLTSGPNERGATSLHPRAALSLLNIDQHAAASSISLSLNNEDQRQQACHNVIDAIAEMVCELSDEKIAELMISLLGQKFGRVSEGVDRSLVWGLAKISRIVKEKDFRRILKLHAKARADPSIGNSSLVDTVVPFKLTVELMSGFGCPSIYGSKYGRRFASSRNPPRRVTECLNRVLGQ